MYSLPDGDGNGNGGGDGGSEGDGSVVMPAATAEGTMRSSMTRSSERVFVSGSSGILILYAVRI